MAELFTANLSALIPNLLLEETDSLTNVFTVTLDNGNVSAVDRVITVPYIISGRAVSGIDYGDIAANPLVQPTIGIVEVTIAAGSISGTATINITPLDDSQVEGLESVILTFQDQDPTNPSGYILGDNESSTIFIVDDSSETAPLPQISVVANDPIAGEVATNTDDSTASFTFIRTNDLNLNSPLTVYFTVGGTATPDPDPSNNPSDSGDYIQTTLGNAFVAPPNSSLPSIRFITFAANETTATVSFNAIDDADFDPNESVSISILPSNLINSDPADQYTIGIAAATATIEDNEELPTVTLSADRTETDESGTITYTITRAGGSFNEDLKVTFSLNGTATNPNILQDANSSIDAGVDPGDDYYIPDLFIETEESDFGETILVSTAPSVLIRAGSTSATFTVQTIDDGIGLDDDGETVIVTLNGNSGYALGTVRTLTSTIRDQNDRGTVTLAVTDGTANEAGNATGTYTLQRVGDNLQEVEVTFDITGTALYGVDKDYTITAVDANNAPIDTEVSNGVLTLTLPAITSPSYNTSANPQVIRINVVPNDDSIRDNTTNTAETVILTLQESSSGLYSIRDGETTGTVNLVDNDSLIPPTISLTLDSTSLIEGGGVTTATFSITLEGGNIFDTAIPISFTLGGTATRALGTALGDYTLTDGILGTDLGSSIVFSASELVDADGDDRIDSVTKTVVLTVQSDAVGFNDDSETVQLTLIDGSGYDLSTDVGDVTSGTVTLFDRTDQGTISVSVTDNLARERNPNDAQDIENPGTFTFTRSGDNLNTALSVTFKLDGTAGLGQSPSNPTTLQTQDYYITATGATLGTITSDGFVTLNFAASTTETTTQQATITVLPLYDLAFEGGVETVNLTLQAATNGSYSLPLNQLGTVNTTLTTGTVNLVDDEVALPPTVTIVAIDEIAGEVLDPTADANVGRFRVYRGIYDGTGDQTLSSNYTNQGNTQLLDLTVNFTTSGNATAGTDYINNLGSSVIIPGGQNYVDVILSPIDDAIANDNSETVTLTLTNGAPNYLIGDTDAVPRTATVTILDNDGNAPSVTVSATDSTASEQGTNYAVFEVERSEDDNLSSAVTVNFTLSGIALPTTDYLVFVNGSAITLVNQVGSVTFAANDTSETIEIRPVSDTLPESNETVTLSLNANPASYTLSTTETAATVVITDTATNPTNRVVPEVTVSALDPSASEVPQGTAAFLITFDGNNATTNPDENLEIAIEIGGTATIGRDYYITSPEIVPTNQPFTTIGAIGGIFINIPSNYIGINGVNTVTLYVTPFDDQDFDPNETVTLRILPSTETNTPSNFADYTLGSADQIVATVTIADNDTVRLPNVTITATDATAGEDLTPEVPGEVAEGTGTFTISRDGTDLSQPLTVSYTISGTATANSDYVSIANSVTIQAGATSATVTITPLDDSNATEGNETVILTLTSPSTNLYTFGSLSSAAVTILDDENPTAIPSVTVDNFARDQDGNIVTTVTNGTTVNVADGAAEVSANENRDLGRFTFTRSTTNLNQSLTVNFLVGGTASAGVDYESIPTSITFSANERTKTLVFTAIDDTTPDADETITIALQSSVDYTIGNPTTGADSIATATIVDNEVIPTISLTASGTELIEGGAAITYTVTRVAGSSGSPLTVNFALTGNAQRILDYNFTSGLVNPTSDSSITLAANQTTATFTIVAATNSIDLIDDGEIINLTLAESTNYLIPVFLTDNPLTIENEALQDNPATAGINESLSNIQALSSQVTLTIRDRSDTGNITLTSTDLLGGEERTGVDDSSTPQDESVNAIVFTLTRSGDNLQTISIPFTITGEASTADYTIDIYSYDANGVVTKVAENQESTIFNTSTGRITLPSFGTSPFDPVLTNGVLTPQIIELHFNPVDDDIIDSLGGVETLTLTLTEDSPNGTYTVGSALTTTQVSLTGSIQDNNDTVSILPIVSLSSAAWVQSASATAFTSPDAVATEARQNNRNAFFTIYVTTSDLEEAVENNTSLPTLGTDLVINLDVLTNAGAATPGSLTTPNDYLALPNSITIEADTRASRIGFADPNTPNTAPTSFVWAYAYTLIVAPQDDSLIEPSETVEVAIAPSTASQNDTYVIDTDRNVSTVTIRSNEDQNYVPEISVTAFDPTGSEDPIDPISDPKEAIFRITRTLEDPGSSLARALQNVSISLEGGTATIGTDYTVVIRHSEDKDDEDPIDLTAPTVSFRENEEFVDVVVKPIADSIVDADETVILTLNDGEAYNLDSEQSSATVSIDDSNIVNRVFVTIELDPALNAANGNLSEKEIAESAGATPAFIIRRYGGTGATEEERTDARQAQSLDVNLLISGAATSGDDYVTLPVRVRIPTGSDVFRLNLDPIRDLIVDAGGDESVTVTIAPTDNNSYTVAPDDDLILNGEVITAGVKPDLDSDTDPEDISATVRIVDNENNAPTLDQDLFPEEFTVLEGENLAELESDNEGLANFIFDAYEDEDNNPIKAIKFVTLPAHGKLTLGAQGEQDVTLLQTIDFIGSDLASIRNALSQLRYTPNDPEFDVDYFGIDSFEIVAQEVVQRVGQADVTVDSNTVEITIDVLPVNDAPIYILPGDPTYDLSSTTANANEDSGNILPLTSTVPGFALPPGSRVVIPQFAKQVDPGAENEQDQAFPNDFTLTSFGDDIFELGSLKLVPDGSGNATLSFNIKNPLPLAKAYGSARVTISLTDNGGTANGGIDTLRKGFFVTTASEDALGQVIQDFTSTAISPSGLSLGKLTYWTATSAIPGNGQSLVATLTQDVKSFGTDAAFDNIVGFYQVTDGSIPEWN